MKIVVFLFLISLSVLHASNEYKLTLSNGVFLDDYSFEFDVEINSDQGLDITSYQCSFTFNYEIIQNGNLEFSYVEGSSDLSNAPTNVVGFNNFDGVNKFSFASNAGLDHLNGDFVRIGRFRITNSKVIIGRNPNILWNFDGSANTILTDLYYNNITHQSNYDIELNNFQSLEYLPVKNVFSSQSSNSQIGNKIVDGLGFNDGNPNSKWVADKIPDYVIIDLGSKQKIYKSELSFDGFAEDKTVTYSIQTSIDLINWNHASDSSLSSKNEWTINYLTPSATRYIKISILSNNNEANFVPGIWEAKFFGRFLEDDDSQNYSQTTPKKYTLNQNYPNPFNPTTNIKFSTPDDDYIKITIYNLIGEQIKVLTDQFYSAGEYEVSFNAENMASGIYLYRLQARNHSEMKKMVLLK